MASERRLDLGAFLTLAIFVMPTLVGCTKTAEDYVRLDRKIAAIKLPNVSYSTSPDVIDSANASSLTFTGTCLTSGGPVSLTGGLVATVACTAGTWTTTINASGVADGILVINANQPDATGVVGTPATVTIPKDTSPTVTASFSKTSDRVTEASTTQSFTVQISAAKLYDTTIPFTVSGTAVYGTDHNLAPGSVTIPAGQTSATISYNLLNNAITQSERRMKISLAPANRSAVALGMIMNYAVDIADDDSGTYHTILAYSPGPYNNTCVIYENNKLFCWGAATTGQLGDGTTTTRLTPVAIDSTALYKDVVHGGTTAASTCGLLTDNTLKCWGANAASQLNDGTTTQRNAPVVSNSGQTFSKIFAGAGTHLCGITTLGKLRCWGNNQNGQLGIGSTAVVTTASNIDATVDYKEVALGATSTCAITTAGVLKCWGANTNGQLGDGSGLQQTSPVVVDAGVSYKSIAMSSGTACGVTVGGVLKCWGLNNYGQIGNGTLVNSPTPVAIDTAFTFSVTAAARGTSATHCALTTTGLLRCWGHAALIGDGASLSRTSPVTSDPGTTYASIRLGLVHACGITTDGNLKCWGNNNSGIIQPYVTQSETTPISVDSSSTFTSFVRGAEHACGLLADGSVRCWGYNTGGQVGDGTTNLRTVPVPAEKGMKYAKIFAGLYHTCGITSLGVLRCWGSNGFSQLGDGTTTSRVNSVVVDSGTTYASVSGGNDTTCGITTTGVLKCWGGNSYGQLGDGTTTLRSTPVVIDSGTTYKFISVGISHSCGVTTTKVLKCWGDNTLGQIGDGTSTARLSPVVINTGTTYATVTTSWLVQMFGSTCATTDAGVLKCWGYNGSYQLGDGTATQRSTPVVIDAGVLYQSVALGSSSACGVTAAGVLKCWGDNTYGIVGDGTFITRTTPVAAAIGSTVVSATPRNTNACGLTTTGTAKCWGGVSGLGTFARGDDFATPTAMMRILEP